MRHRGSVCLMVVLAGCAGTPYVQPTSGATAQVAFANQTPYRLSVYHYAVASDCREPMSLVEVLQGQETGARVKAGGEWAFSMNAGDDKLGCIVAGSFHPQTDARYRAALRYENSRCILSLLTDRGEAVAFAPKVAVTPFAANGPFCAAR
jgi:hypothetical protein